MNILFYTQWWQPERCFKGQPFAEELVKRGHKVQILTGFPNYPTGKIFSPYRLKLFHREIMNGVIVNRVLLYPSHDYSTFKRILNYLSFMFFSFLLGPFLIRKPDVVYVYNLITLYPFALLLKFIYHSKIVFDIEDIWPESIISSGMMKKSSYMKGFDKYCKWVYSRSDVVTVLSTGFKEYLTLKGIFYKKIRVVYNWCEESEFPIENSRFISKEKDKNTLNILFAGSIGPAQGLESIIESAVICMEKKIIVKIRIIGHGICFEKIKSHIKEKKLTNCEVFPGRPLREMGDFFEWADVMLVHLKDCPLFSITIPSKVQAYLFLGKPILMAMRGSSAEIIHESKAGFVCSPDNPNEIVSTIEKIINTPPDILKKMGENGRVFYKERMSFALGVSAYEAIFKSIGSNKEI